MKGKLVIISAPSGAGKTTIVNHLLEMDLDLEFSISATTRKPRDSEKNGREYFFLTVEEFKKRVNNNEFAEWEEVYTGNFYGTLKSEINRILTDRKNVLFDVDVMGGINLKKLYRTRAISIFIMPPSQEELEKRLIKRGTDETSKIMMRVEKSREEMKLAGSFDHIVVNDSLKKAKDEAYSLVYKFLTT